MCGGFGRRTFCFWETFPNDDRCKTIERLGKGMATKSDELRNARKNKNDEFYTQRADIDAEMRHYKEYFEGKTVFCNCDDPFESNFFKYFASNFNFLKLKKLIATCYVSSPISCNELVYDVDQAGQLCFFPTKDSAPLMTGKEKRPYKIEITEVNDENGDGAIDIADVEYLLKNKKNTLTLLEGDGDFRSEECIELLKEADIVSTNPPFSLFREYVAQLFEYDKKFIIIGNVNAIAYKEVFPLVKDNKMWMGCSIHSGDREFRVPDSYPLNAAGFRIDADGTKYIRVKGVRWFTNIDNKDRHEIMPLYKKYTPNEYPTYDNFDAVNVNTTSDIPYDYSGIMGVPVTFLDKYNPEQFEIIGMGTGDTAKMIGITKNYRGRTDLAYTVDGVSKCPYNRILIRRKKNED